PVHRSRLLARWLLSPYWTTCEEATLIQRCLGENLPPSTQRKTYRRVVNDPTSKGSSWDRPLLCWLASYYFLVGADCAINPFFLDILNVIVKYRYFVF